MKIGSLHMTRAAGIAAALITFGAPELCAQWKFTPYVWATGVNADVSRNGSTVVDAHVPFSDLLHDVDKAAMLRIEAQRGRFGAMVDLFFVGMSTSGNEVALPDGAQATLDAKLDLTILDATASWALGRDGQGLAFVAGTRVVGERTQLGLAIPTSATTSITEETDVSDVLFNGIAGLRFRRHLTRRLSVEAHGDAGTGETQLTWSGGSEMTFAFGSSHRYALHVGYKTMTIDFKEDESVQTSIRMSGLLTGFRIAF